MKLLPWTKVSLDQQKLLGLREAFMRKKRKYIGFYQFGFFQFVLIYFTYTAMHKCWASYSEVSRRKIISIFIFLSWYPFGGVFPIYKREKMAESYTCFFIRTVLFKFLSLSSIPWAKLGGLQFCFCLLSIDIVALNSSFCFPQN